MSGQSMSLNQFLERYPPRPYRLRPGMHEYPPAQLAPVTEADGLFLLDSVPSHVPRGRPRLTESGRGEHCHLWVIDHRGRPCILEAPLSRLGDGWLHHTNLTGGGKASIGGEVWFEEPRRIFLSGSSFRYPPRDRVHLEAAEDLFRAVGFKVMSLGWDEETDTPMRVWLRSREAPGR